MVALGLVLLFLLTQATTNRALYEQNYASLFVINVAVAGLLLAIILWVVWRLWVRLRQGRFGSRLLVKLAAVFALAGFAPGVLIYVVSYQFVARSIETWFDVKVEGALDAGLNLGRVTLETLSAELGNKTAVVAAQIAELPEVGLALSLERAREQIGAGELLLWSSSGQLVAAAGQSRYQISPERPSAQQMRRARSQRITSWTEGLEEGPASEARFKALVAVSAVRVGLLAEPRFLLATQRIPPTLVANALAVTEANREYQERALAREGLKRMYIGTLTLALFLAVFGAVLLALLLGNQIARPLLLLADGVRQVAAGDLRPKASLQGRDELDGLTRAFAQMTQQLADARQAVEASMEQVDAARANLQTILDNLTAGVMVLDAQGRILSANPGATRILRVPLAARHGQRLVDIEPLSAFAQAVQAQFDVFLGSQQEHGLDHWQHSFELGEPAASSVRASNDTVTLVARGAQLPGAARLLVFDDISEIVSAQRAQAWGEVARRLAHEIKNPLTPIQLSAERLELKLQGKLDPPDQALLVRSVKTIVDQVDAMKRLVNEFRDYARLPAAELKPVDLNALVNDVLHLYAAEPGATPVRAQLDPDCQPIWGDAQQLRQVLHNLVQNALDATETAGPAAGEQRVVRVRTQWLADAGRVRLSVLDAGGGFPDAILKRAFEPYVTTKSRGTGLGLAVVKKIADEHRTRVDIVNRTLADGVTGAQVSLSFAASPVGPVAPDGAGTPRGTR
ncbi:MAG: HAMP domain-containing protein [Rhodoferax sp.]|nr:HAMP domain-containing protein [Rhodoferax sp.]